MAATRRSGFTGPAEVVAELTAQLRAGALRLPERAVAPGTPLDPVVLKTDVLARLFPFAARRALGVASGRAKVTAVVWRDGGDELAVDPAGATVATSAGAVVVTFPVACDQTGAARAQVTFVVGAPDRPAGLYAATDGRPGGPAVVVERWADALTALAWSAVLELLDSVSAALGRDEHGDPFVAGALVATRDAVTLTPMARHRLGRLSS